MASFNLQFIRLKISGLVSWKKKKTQQFVKQNRALKTEIYKNGKTGMISTLRSH